MPQGRSVTLPRERCLSWTGWTVLEARPSILPLGRRRRQTQPDPAATVRSRTDSQARSHEIATSSKIPVTHLTRSRRAPVTPHSAAYAHAISHHGVRAGLAGRRYARRASAVRRGSGIATGARLVRSTNTWTKW